jgi:hypothetical protein
LVESVSFAVLVKRLGRLADSRMRQICGGRLRWLTPGVAQESRSLSAKTFVCGHDDLEAVGQ